MVVCVKEVEKGDMSDFRRGHIDVRLAGVPLTKIAALLGVESDSF
jgi:hypothetical protein